MPRPAKNRRQTDPRKDARLRTGYLTDATFGRRYALTSEQVAHAVATVYCGGKLKQDIDDDVRELYVVHYSPEAGGYLMVVVRPFGVSDGEPELSPEAKAAMREYKVNGRHRARHIATRKANKNGK